MTRNKRAQKPSEEAAIIVDRRGRRRKAHNAKPAERGLGPKGGAWNLKQASAWSGIGENYLRTMAKNREIPCAFYIGRRIILPRDGFKKWFNSRADAA
jgi:hypothetical protein